MAEIREDLQKYKLYSIEDLVPVLGKSHQTIKRYLASGQLKGIKVGRAWRVTEENLKEFLGQ